MRKIFFVIACYQNEKQELYDRYIEPKNKAYCLKHGFEYLCIKTPPPLFRGNPTWWKFTVLKEMIDSGELKEGDHFTHLDADMVIVQDYIPYISSKSFTYAIDNGNTHCMGNYSIKVNEWSVNLVNEILSEVRFRNPYKQDFINEFREQAVWYQIAAIIRHSWIPFFDLANYGYHSSIPISGYDDPPFSLGSLLANVEIRGPEWNTTLLSCEADNDVSKSLEQYNIVKSRKKDTIIRHFAGGQPWRMDYLQQ